jgi:hypothetical protein
LTVGGMVKVPSVSVAMAGWVPSPTLATPGADPSVAVVMRYVTPPLVNVSPSWACAIS